MEVQMTRTQLTILAVFLLSLIIGSIANGGLGVLVALLYWVGAIITVVVIVAFYSLVGYGLGYGFTKGKERAERKK